MEYMLDTNICIYILKERPLSVLKRFKEMPMDWIVISVVTLAELMYGVEQSSARERNLRNVEDFIAKLRVIPWDNHAARNYGKARAHLESKGRPIGNMDLLIASHARSRGAVVVTHNEREFRRVPDLAVENWA